MTNAEKPLYKVEKVSKGYAIVRQDGSYVNEQIWPTRESAEGRLELLRLLGWCRVESM